LKWRDAAGCRSRHFYHGYRSVRLYTSSQAGRALDYQHLKTQKKYWLIIFIAFCVTLTALCMVALVFWQRLPPGQIRELISAMVIDYFAYFFSAGFILLLAFGFAADWIYRAYVIPINRLAEEVD
jgi:cellulose synthase/poly-beta-1,6-N-acetylglucosamine synthase-like glycosyltransferase